MSTPFDDDELQPGMARGLMGDPNQINAPGLGGALIQMLGQALPRSTAFPPPVSPDIPGGMGPLSRALAGLSDPGLASSAMPNGLIDHVGIVPPDSTATPAPADKSMPSATDSTAANTTSKLDLDKAMDYLDKNALPAYD